MFAPRPQYRIEYKPIRIISFHQFSDKYVVRPPYQRKNVWPPWKQRAWLDSLMRRYYIPRMVLREVYVEEDKMRYEVIDGQQRIQTVQRFFQNELELPDSLGDFDPQLPGKCYRELPVELREFIAEEIFFDVDIVSNIEDPYNPEHQTLAAQIFWRLQQGVNLNFMEVAHSQLSSLARNFVVKYADDISFDYDAYEPVDENPDVHPFFGILNRSNDRMQHLTILLRLLMIEFADGPTEIRDTQVAEFVRKWERSDGISNFEMENMPEAKRLLTCLSDFCQIFKDDPMVQDGSPVRELRTDYFILSFVMLLRHLRNHYAVQDEHREAFHDFLIDFYAQWDDSNNEDPEILMFSNNRQMDKSSIEIRDRVLRELFFRYLDEQGISILVKDEQRTFSEAQRISIYRLAHGVCQMCRAEEKSEKDARVPWSQYEADHVLPHSKGGLTDVQNAQVLCEYHNQLKADGPAR